MNTRRIYNKTMALLATALLVGIQPHWLEASAGALEWEDSPNMDLATTTAPREGLNSTLRRLQS